MLKRQMKSLKIGKIANEDQRAVDLEIIILKTID